jgi:hypothetical protein
VDRHRPPRRDDASADCGSGACSFGTGSLVAKRGRAHVWFPKTTHAVERGDELCGMNSFAVVDIDRAQKDRALWADQISRRYRDQPFACSSVAGRSISALELTAAGVQRLRTAAATQGLRS